jgi:hypothetical protein
MPGFAPRVPSMQAPPASPADLDQQRFRWTALTVAVTSVAAAAFGLAFGLTDLPSIAVAGVAVFLSKLFIFGGAIELWPFDKTTLDFNAWELALVAWVLDLWVSCALLAGISSFERLPFAGRAMSEARARAGLTLREYPGLRRLAVSGIALLVFLPIPASGAVTGTLVGRLVGLSRMATFGAVAGGAGLAVCVYAAVATFFGENWRSLLESPTLVVISLIAFVIFVWIAWLRVRRALTRE